MSSLSVALREHKMYKKDTLSGIEPSVIILARSNRLQLQHEGRRCRMLRPLPGLGPRFLCSSQERCGRKLKLILGETFWSSSSLVFNHCKTVKSLFAKELAATHEWELNCSYSVMEVAVLTTLPHPVQFEFVVK